MDASIIKIIQRGLIFGITAAIGMGGTILLADRFYSFEPNQVVSSSQINRNFDKLPPIGAVIAWHKSLPGAPATLPDGWIECNGQTITDGESDFNGQTAPDLNTNARFLRGGTTSGTLQSHQLQDHRHFWLNQSGDISQVLWFLRQYMGAEAFSGGGVNFTDGGVSQTAQNSLIGGAHFGNVGAETRPINMSVVWIMRIK